MKVSPALIGILGGAALVAGAVMFGSWNWRLHSEAEMRLGQARALEVHEQALRSRVEAGDRRTRELSASLLASSNRIGEVTGWLEAEKATHDPLRHQIEKMLAEQIRIRDSLARRDKVVADQETDLGSVRKTNGELRAQNQGQQERIARLEMDLKSAGEREATVRLQWVEARTGVTNLTAKLDETRQRLDDVSRRLAESERLIADLQKQKQAAEAAATAVIANAAPTNAAPTVSAP